LTALTARLQWGLIPAVPVPFRGSVLAEDAQRAYARWMAAQPVVGVAVWAHTGRGPHLSAAQRRAVLAEWRGALAGKLIVAGVRSVEMALEAKRGGADALLAFPCAEDPVAHHAALARELPVIAFYLYEAAGGVAYDDATLHAILALPGVVGVKVATLDSVVTFQRIAALVDQHPKALLITGTHFSTPPMRTESLLLPCESTPLVGLTRGVSRCAHTIADKRLHATRGATPSGWPTK